MASSARSRHAVGLLVLLAWIGAVLWGFRRVHTAEPLATLALLALWLGIFTLAAAGYGAVLWRLLLRRLPRGWLEHLVALAWGMGGLAAAGLPLSAAGLFRPLPLLVVLVGGAAAGGWSLRGRRIESPAHLPRAVLPFVAVVIIVAAFTLLIVPTLSPFYDQLHYHLAFPYQWLRAGRIVTFPRNAYSFLPAVMGVLYAYALAALGPWAAQAVHWWAGALAAVTAGGIAGRLGGPRAGWVGAAVFAATPAVVQASTWAAADLGAAAFAVAGWLMILVAADDGEVARRGAWWLGVGAMAGMAAGAKVLALGTVAAPLLVGVLLLGRTAGGRTVRRLLLVGAGCVLAFAPWAVRNVVATGNPIYPFGARLAAAVTGAANQEEEVLARGIAAPERTTLDLPALATLATFKPLGEAGSVGPVYLALLPLAAWVAWRDRRRFVRVLAVAVVVGVLAWGVAPLRARFLLPVLGPLAALVGLAWQRGRARAPARVRPLLTSLLVFMLAWSVATAAWTLGLRRLACTAGAASGEALMREYASYWPAARLVNERLPLSAKLLLVGESRTLNIDRDVVVEDPFHTPLLVELAAASSSPQGIAERLRVMGVTHVLINRHEETRIAEMNGWPEYFYPTTPEVHRRLDRFLSECLEPLFRVGPVEVFALGGCP
jgi:hypothetical protein